MTAKKIHQYFDRASSQWNIIDFLNECDVESYEDSIDVYLKSLEHIANSEEGSRHERASILLGKYRQGTDRQQAKKWMSDRSQKQIHIHQPTFSGGANFNWTAKGSISGGVFLAEPSEPPHKKRFTQKEQERTEVSRNLSSDEGEHMVENDAYEFEAITDFIRPSTPRGDEHDVILDILKERCAELLPKWNSLSKIEKCSMSLARSSILNIANQSDVSCMSWMGQCPKARKLVAKLTRETEKWESEIFSFQFDKCANAVIREIEQIAHEKGTTEALRRCALLRCNTSGEVYETVIDIYTHVLRFFKYNPNVFAATSDKDRDWSELDYVVRMTAPIIECIFRDTSDSLRLRWGERASMASKIQMKANEQAGENQRSPLGRKCDLLIQHRATGLELSSSEFAGNLKEDKIVYDQGKNLRVSKSIFDRIVDEVPLSDDDANSLFITGLQVCELEGGCHAISLPYDGLYVVFSCGPDISFPQSLAALDSLKPTLQLLFNWKLWHMKISGMLDKYQGKLILRKYHKRAGLTNRKGRLNKLKKYTRSTYFSPPEKKQGTEA